MSAAIGCLVVFIAHLFDRAVERYAINYEEGMCAPDAVVAWGAVTGCFDLDVYSYFHLRLPSYSCEYDFMRRRHRLAQRVLLWTSINGWTVAYRFT